MLHDYIKVNLMQMETIHTVSGLQEKSSEKYIVFASNSNEMYIDLEYNQDKQNPKC